MKNNVSNSLLLQWGCGWNPTFPISFNKILWANAIGTINAFYCMTIIDKTNTNLTFLQWHSAKGASNKTACLWCALGI